MLFRGQRMQQRQVLQRLNSAQDIFHGIHYHAGVDGNQQYITPAAGKMTKLRMVFFRLY
jgi:hypothetical protein